MAPPELRRKATNEGSQTAPRPAEKSTLDLRKRPREQTVSPEASTSMRPEEKRPKTKQPEEWVEIPARRELRKKKPKPALRKPKQLKRMPSLRRCI